MGKWGRIRNQCEERKLEFDTLLLERKEKKRSKLACPRSQGFVMRIGRTLRKSFFSGLDHNERNQRGKNPGSSLFRFCYQARAVSGSCFKWHIL